MRKGLVSVIMSAYNSEAFIEEAIYSILNQTYTNLELIIINDGSTDETENIIQSITDPRIIYLKNADNKGNKFSRNAAIEKASGEFITILDSDDIALPNRIEKEVNYLLKHPETDLVFSDILTFNGNSENHVSYPVENEYIRAFLFFKNCIPQPSVMFRSASLVKHLPLYRNDLYGPEDFEAWFRLSQENIVFAGINSPLVKYRISQNQISVRNKTLLDKRQRDFFIERLKYLQLEISGDRLDVIYDFIEGRVNLNEKDFKVIKHFLKDVYIANIRLQKYPQNYFNAALYFFYLRLGKYFFLENKKPLQFLKYFAAVVYMLGLKSFYIFTRNNKFRQ